MYAGSVTVVHDAPSFVDLYIVVPALADIITVPVDGFTIGTGLASAPGSAVTVVQDVPSFTDLYTVVLELLNASHAVPV